VTGTGLSLNVIRDTLESGIGKPDKVRGIYDTGWFHDSEAQRHYLDLYLPASFLKSGIGSRIIDRVALWLCGRYDNLSSREFEAKSCLLQTLVHGIICTKSFASWIVFPQPTP
jgi:hypothetical protein